MLTVLNKKDHFAQMSYRRFLHKVGWQSYTLKEQESSKKLFWYQITYGTQKNQARGSVELYSITCNNL